MKLQRPQGSGSLGKLQQRVPRLGRAGCATLQGSGVIFRDRHFWGKFNQGGCSQALLPGSENTIAGEYGFLFRIFKII